MNLSYRTEAQIKADRERLELRDRLAEQAMVASIRQGMFAQIKQGDYVSVARSLYAFADAMLQARDGK